MKGYTSLNMEMLSKYGDMTYEINKKYSTTDKTIRDKDIFLFYKYLEDMEDNSRIMLSRIFEVEAENEITDKDNMFHAESIILVRELSKEEIHQYFEDNQERILKKPWYCRKALADQGLCLDKLIYDKEPFVREAVARQGYNLDILAKDENEFVRVAVAEQGYKLNTLLYDSSSVVRMAAAGRGYGLDILSNDENMFVRMIATMQKRNLDK